MKIESNNIFGVVVWYNPTQKNIDSLRTYVDEVKTLFVVDNSDSDNRMLLEGCPSNIVYLSNNENLGIAEALNIGCRECVKAGATWILTMDQDSRFLQTKVSDLVAEANEYSEIDQVGIFSAYQDCDGKHHHKRGRFQPFLAVMTSGNLLRAEAFNALGGFRTNFFIDLVDDEFCCRLKLNNYQVIRLNNCILTHQLGNGPKKVLPFLSKTYIQHSPLRHYYIVRNIHKLMQLYPEYKDFYKKQLHKRIKRTLLYDYNQKFKKIKYMFWGWQDFKQNKFGKFNRK